VKTVIALRLFFAFALVASASCRDSTSPTPETPSLAPSGPDEFLFVDRSGHSLQLAGEDGTIRQTFAGFRFASRPVWSSDGRSFVTTEAIYPGGGTFLIQANDSGRTSLPTGVPVAFIGGSRDGTVLIRTSTPTCSLQSFRVDIATTQCLRKGPVDAVSPDGTRAVWASQKTPGELWVGSLSGSDSTRLTTRFPSGTRRGTVVWAPNSQWFAYEQQDGENIDVYRAGRNGQSIRNLTPNEAYDSPTSISPDGRWLTFISFRMPSGTYVTSADGADTRWLTDVRGRDTQWSPDGEQIVTVASNFQLAIVQANGTGQLILPALDLGVAWRPRQ
jgi:hypothetical protein